jgi:hypothetical protein
VLVIRGRGFVSEDAAAYRVTLRGMRDGTPIHVEAEAQRVSDGRLDLALTGTFAAVVLGGEAAIAGDLAVERLSGPGVSARASLEVALSVRETLVPELLSLAPLDATLAEPLALDGDGLLQPGEGASWARFQGTFTTTVPPGKIAIEDLWAPLVPVDPESRDAATLTLLPELFGVYPGHFEGTILVTNLHASGVEIDSGTLPIEKLEVGATALTELGPLQVSRGQWLTALGRGFVPADDAAEQSTVIVLEGEFQPTRGERFAVSGPSAWSLFPDRQPSHTELGVIVRVDYDKDGEAFGLGALPGRFHGNAYPMVLWQTDVFTGEPLPLDLTIRAPRQIVYLELLASFDEALGRFGLLAERAAILARVVEVFERDYAQVNIEVRLGRPVDFSEYVRVEVGADDPNGLGLFGLDNSTGKDVGNRRFDDVVGGFNAETRKDGMAAYGGIFVAEFLSFSPTLSTKTIVSQRFDEVFGPLVPELGGTPAQAGEAGPRGETIGEAVRVLGNLIGTTVTHEVGHTLGLAAFEGQFHNPGDTPGELMDSGVYRPFAERAELDGEGPEIFGEVNLGYLRAVLPLDEP